MNDAEEQVLNGAKQPVRSHPRAFAALALLAMVAACSAGSSQASVTVEGRVFTVEVARTTEEQRAGLSGRAAVPAGTGMLFVFGGRAPREMWMADMRVPLDLAWIDGDRVIGTATVHPCTRPVRSECPVASSPGPADALLEVPAGALAGVSAGAPITIQDQQT